MKRTLLLVVLAGTLAAPAAAQAAPCSALPSKLTVSTGGFPVGQRTVSWDQNQHALLVQDTDLGGHRKRLYVVRPTCQRWQQFWRTVGFAHVWDWRARYVDPDVYDGWWWSVQLERGRQHVTSHGANDSPPLYDVYERGVVQLISPLRFAARG